MFDNEMEVFYKTKKLKVKTPERILQLVWDEVWVAIKKVGEVVSAIISLVNNRYSCLVELLRVSAVMFVQKRLVKKRLLLLMSSDSKM